eukprot:TRINITY_DN35394_c0_g2_i1.p1 TRINITY_DN35394_c0_g2~~TRINITY_DN35394_c0_g2_i1.p1  ORF type:complete len:534 (+),score=211.95 TRINITY_DN35394_c0_g2_i1:98-1699(+)
MAAAGPAGDDLRARLFFGLAAVSGVLVALLGYQLGALGQDAIDARLVADYARVNTMLRERSKLCDGSLQSGQAPEQKQQGDVARLQQENDLLERENELLAQTNDDMTRANEECEEDLLTDREKRTGTRESNATAVVHRMYYEVAQLEAALSGIKEEHQDGKALMRHKIRALRLENSDLRARVEQVEKERNETRRRGQQSERERQQDGEGAQQRPQQQRQGQGVGALAALCEDSVRHCPEWAAQGECERNTGYMHAKCRLSCGQCGQQQRVPPRKCEDQAEHCQSWAGKGECKVNPTFMLRKCPLSCKACDAGEPPDKAAREAAQKPLPVAAVHTSERAQPVPPGAAAAGAGGALAAGGDYTIRRKPGDKIGIRFNGVQVLSVAAGSPAEAAGVPSGVSILTIDGASVSTHEDVRNAFTRAGQTVVVRLSDEMKGLKAEEPMPCGNQFMVEVVHGGPADAPCGRRRRMVTLEEAEGCKVSLCLRMGRWYVVRIAAADGQPRKLSGKGYNCRIEPFGESEDPLTNALCTTVPQKG